ncbi:MAG: hypothetical protein NC253_04605 [Ruminococcus sp.]|nr:hypothetical protein [Ruminococcus sp.]MCM1381381.1 hypothetical protein [Muribaculaceae bacterium]MCM1479282.1 hypothetical protein [Muribaculaceae bacterium]
MCKKILLGTVLAAAVCLSACEKETEIVDDFTTTTAPQTGGVQTVTAAETGDGFELVPNPDPGEETKSAEEAAYEKQLAEWETAAEYFAEHGLTFEGGNPHLYIDMDNFPDTADPLAGVEEKYAKYFDTLYISNGAGRDFSFIANHKETKTLVFEDDIGETDLSFLADCENLEFLWFRNKTVNAESLAEAVKNSHLKELLIETEEYSPGAADVIMRAAPACEVTYREKYVYAEPTAAELKLYTNLLVVSSAENPQKWDGGAGGELPSWGYRGSLVCTFTNLTEETYNLTSVRIFKEESGTVTNMTFADGSTALDIDLTVNPSEKTDFDIPEDMFPFSKCETGVYNIEFDGGSEKFSQRFAIDNGGAYNEEVTFDADIWEQYLYGARTEDGITFYTNVPAFLDGEQREAYKSAFVITSLCFGSSGSIPEKFFDSQFGSHTEEEFYSDFCKGYTRDYAYSKLERYGFIDENGKLRVGSWDGGSDPSHFGDVFVPLYSDENEVIFKCVTVHCHDSAPEQAWFEEVNFRTVKTDEGWKFDNFRYLG